MLCIHAQHPSYVREALRKIICFFKIFFKLLSNILFCLDANDNPEPERRPGSAADISGVYLYLVREDVVVAALLGYPHNNSVHSQSPCYFVLRNSLLTRHVELDVPGDDGGGCDPVPGAAGEHLGQVGLGRTHLQHRHRAPVTVPEQHHPIIILLVILVICYLYQNCISGM